VDDSVAMTADDTPGLTVEFDDSRKAGWVDLAVDDSVNMTADNTPGLTVEFDDSRKAG
jgi:hypothetical protein